MIFTFRIVSDEVDNFKREIKIDASSTFLDFKNVLCESVGYDKEQLSSFFLCNRDWEKEKEISYADMGAEDDQDLWLMDDSELGDFIADEGQRLIYVFDMEPGKNLKDPVCSLSLGQAPVEIMDMDEFDAGVETKAAAAATSDMDEDFYGSDSYNEDEFDSEGFDEMNFEEKF